MENKGTARGKAQILIDYIPAAATLVAAAVCCIVHALTAEETSAVIIAQMIGLGLIPLVFPVCNAITKRPFPVIYPALTGVLVLLSMLGSGFGLYYILPWWDLLLHGSFGALCAAVVYYLSLKRQNGEAWRLIVVFFFVMGVGAMWEIFEYNCDLIFGGDAQKVKYCMEIGVSPVADTMEDLMITVAGIVVFYCGLLVKYIVKRKKSVGDGRGSEV